MQNELLVGDLAPALPPADYLRGTPISDFEPGRIYVVECWATWCGPCVEAIPHLTKLQETYPDVTIVGFAVMEKDPARVRAFVTEKGDAMGYAVALDAIGDDGEGWMVRNWLTPSYLTAIPAAFIVGRDRRIAWIGHPELMDDVLASVVEGSFDLQDAADRYRAKLAQDLTREDFELRKVVRRCLTAKDGAGALQAYDAAFAACPALEAQEGLAKLRLLLSEDCAAAPDYARRILGAFATRENHLSLAVAGALTETLKTHPHVPEKCDLADLIIEAVQDEGCIALAERSLWVAYDRAQALAIAYFTLDRLGEAIQQAEIALAHATTLELRPEMTSQLRLLADHGKRTAKAAAPKGPTVVCEGDSCRLVFDDA